MVLNKLKVGLTYQASLVETGGSGSLTDQISRNMIEEFVIGSGAASTADVEWHSTNRALNTTNETHDLAGGVTDAKGATKTFTKVRSFYARNLSAAGTLTIDTTVANGAVGIFNGVIPLGPGEEVLLVRRSAAGGAIVAGTADLVKCTSDANLLYEIGVAGE